MDISVELSLYPLQDSYKKPIISFIALLKEDPGIEVVENSMSTQVFGPYDRVTSLIKGAAKHLFETHPSVVLVAKMVNTDTRKL